MQKSFSLDHLTDIEFEQFCYDLLIELGFVNLDWRKGTGLDASPSDQGRDIVCGLVVEDIDRTKSLERWFVQCKHYQRGVPPDKLQGALAWANADRPDKLLIIASNFLSNPAKENLERFSKNNNPAYKIKVWERPNLEQLTADKQSLLHKYGVRPSSTSANISMDSLRDPLFLKGLAQTIADALLSSAAVSLDSITPFDGGGIYAIYYAGGFPAYAPLVEFNRANITDLPVYIGKAISSRDLFGNGIGSYLIGNQLFRRLGEHSKSITQASNLSTADFYCRYLILPSIWCSLGEYFLIEQFHPLWNTTVDGFGTYDPGSGRVSMKCSNWDVLHPGRAWASSLQGSPEAEQEITAKIQEELTNRLSSA